MLHFGGKFKVEVCTEFYGKAISGYRRSCTPEVTSYRLPSNGFILFASAKVGVVLFQEHFETLRFEV